MERLGIRRNKAALALYERSRGITQDHTNSLLVEGWQPKNRMKLKPVLHRVSEIKERYHLSDYRSEVLRVTKLPLHSNIKTL